MESADVHGVRNSSSENEFASSIPERRLLLEIVDRAVQDLSCSKAREREDAREWFLNTTPGQNMSFSFVCELADLDKASLLKSLRLRKLLPKS